MAQNLNAAFDSETSGVLIHVLDGATEQTQHYKFCENSLDPGCSAAGGSGGRRRLPETSGGFYDKPPVCGRTAFSVVNKLAWSEEEQQLQGPWAHEEAGLEVVGDEVEPPSPLIIATDVMLQTATCLFPGDAKPGRRTANGCGRSVSATCAANCGPAPAACAAAGADEPVWCSQPGQFFDDGCAMPGTELPGMLEQFDSAWSSARAELHMGGEVQWTTAVIDASTWNAALPKAVWAFAADTRCMMSTQCLDELHRLQCDFRVEFGVEVPLIGLDLSLSTAPFTALSEFRPQRVKCKGDVCDSATPLEPPQENEECDNIDGVIQCDSLDDITGLVGPLNTEWCVQQRTLAPGRFVSSHPPGCRQLRRTGGGLLRGLPGGLQLRMRGGAAALPRRLPSALQLGSGRPGAARHREDHRAGRRKLPDAPRRRPWCRRPGCATSADGHGGRLRRAGSGRPRGRGGICAGLSRGRLWLR